MAIEALKSVIPEAVPIEVAVPDNDTHGHYSTNVAFRLAKLRGTAPIAIAESLKHELEARHSFARVEVAGNGFINMWLSHKSLEAGIADILKKKKAYGMSTLPRTGRRKIQIEYISANPTGPLTLANGRGGFLGDALANIFEAVGHTVEREYYVNDTGNQVRTLGLSLLSAQGYILDEEKFYKGEYVKEWAAKNASLVKRYVKKPEQLGAKAAAQFLAAIKKVIEKKAGIHFDRYTSEARHIHAKHFTDKAMAMFKKRGLVYESEGAVWLKTTEFHDDKDRVLITKEGAPTYFLADAGHYLETEKRGFDTKLIILGPDHYGYVSRIQVAAAIVGIEHSHVLITQAVRLIQEGEEVKMSKRRGTFVTFEELIDEVPKDAARFFFQMISPDTHMDFDLDLAKEHSLKNPVFYAQYAYVRTRGIIKKAGAVRGKPDLSLLESEGDVRLMRKLAEFPDVVRDAADTFAVHHVTRYVLELSKLFHNFYEKEHVSGVEERLGTARLALVSASAIVLKNALALLGISTPEKM